MPPIGFRKLVEQALPGNYSELRQRSGLAESTVKRWIKLMHAEGAVHISGWQRCTGNSGHGGRFMPVFTAGAGKDKPCLLKRLTSAETSTAWRKRERAAGRWHEVLERCNSMKWAKKARTRGHSFEPLAALFGRRPAPTKGGV